MLSRTWVQLALLLAVAAVFNGFTLLNYPATFVDEGWNASRSLALLQTGRQFAGVDSGVYQHFEGYWTYWPWLGSAIHAVAIQLLGLSLTTIRVVSLLFGLALLLVMFRLGASLVNRRTGFLAAGLLAVSLPFFYSSHMARHDIIVAAMGYGAIALQVTEARSAATGWNAFPFRSLLAGFLIGLGLDIHLNILVLVPVMGLLYLMDSGRAILKSKPFWAFGLGLAAGVLYYAAMHVLPYPLTVASIANLSEFSGRVPILFRADLALWLGALGGTVGHLDPRMLPVVTLGVVALISRWSSSDRRVLLVFVAVVLAYMLVTSYKTMHYAIMIAPAVALLVAAFLNMLLGRPIRSSLWAFTRLALVVGIVAGTGILNISTIWNANNNDYNKTADVILRSIPEGASIIGPPTYWFLRPYQPYVNWEQLQTHRLYYGNSGLEEVFNYYQPDYIIMDGFVEFFRRTDPEQPASGRPGKIPAAEMWQILSERGTLLGEVETEPYGIVRIYKMAWQAP